MPEIKTMQWPVCTGDYVVLLLHAEHAWCASAVRCGSLSWTMVRAGPDYRPTNMLAPSFTTMATKRPHRNFISPSSPTHSIRRGTEEAHTAPQKSTQEKAQTHHRIPIEIAFEAKKMTTTQSSARFQHREVIRISAKSATRLFEDTHYTHSVINERNTCGISISASWKGAARG